MVLQRPLKAPRPCSMFHVDSDGDESTGKEPCHQAFLVGMRQGSDIYEQIMCIIASNK